MYLRVHKPLLSYLRLTKLKPQMLIFLISLVLMNFLMTSKLDDLSMLGRRMYGQEPDTVALLPALCRMYMIVGLGLDYVK